MHRVVPALAFLCLVWSAPALAQDVAERLELCETCHGEAGIPQEKDTPIIWGQNYYYLYVQLKDYKAGRRTHELMSAVVADMTREDMQALAKHFSAQPWPMIPHRATDDQIARAKQAAVAAACPACHFDTYLGNNSDTPRVAGQQQAYLERTMRELKSKVRVNAPFMGAMFGTFDDAEIMALSHFLAAMQGPAGPVPSIGDRQ